MTLTPDGGPALSVPDAVSLRDWFAGMALMGHRSNPHNYLASGEVLAEWSCRDADAMLAAREKEEK